MKSLLLLLSSLLILREAIGPPVTTKKNEGEDENEVSIDPDGDLGIEYNRYLQEVVQALESDPQFKEKLEKAEPTDIRTGKIARELEFVSHHVRSKLDELKRQELERLRHIAMEQHKQEQLQAMRGAEGAVPRQGEKTKQVTAPHLDYHNPHTFEVEDLMRLITQTTSALEKADRKRREEFKQYELQKEYEKQELLRRAEDENQRKKLEAEFEEREQKHKKHPQLHHPGSKQQLKEVWQEQDHMNPDDFNPKTFFHLHDLDGNGVWDADEVKTLFQKELDKMYDPSAPEDDVKERQEEMERMREHVFNESDTNGDFLISYDEFLAQTKKTEYEQDQGWEGLDHTPAYTHEEYEAFEQQRLEEVRKLVEQGLIPPQPVFQPPPMYQHPAAVPNQGYGQVHPGQQQYGHGNQIPQHHPMASNQVYHVPPGHINQPPQVYHQGQPQYHPMAASNAQHPAQGYGHNVGHQGAYQNQPVPGHQGYQQKHPPAAQQGYPQQQGYNQNQQPHVQGQVPPVPVRAGEVPSQVHPHGSAHNAGVQQGPPHSPQVPPHPPQAVINQNQVGGIQNLEAKQMTSGQHPAGSHVPASDTNSPSGGSQQNLDASINQHPPSNHDNPNNPSSANHQNAQNNNAPIHPVAGEPAAPSH